jgi:hypothetical protein
MVGERPWSELTDERVAPTAAGSSGCARLDGLFDYVHTRACVYLYSFRARQVLISNGQPTMRRHS